MADGDNGKVALWVAVIALIGTLGTAIIAKLPEDFFRAHKEGTDKTTGSVENKEINKNDSINASPNRSAPSKDENGNPKETSLGKENLSTSEPSATVKNLVITLTEAKFCNLLKQLKTVNSLDWFYRQRDKYKMSKRKYELPKFEISPFKYNVLEGTENLGGRSIIVVLTLEKANNITVLKYKSIVESCLGTTMEKANSVYKASIKKDISIEISFNPISGTFNVWLNCELTE